MGVVAPGEKKEYNENVSQTYKRFHVP